MKERLLMTLILILLGGGLCIPPVLSAGVPEMTKEELNSLLGKPELIVLDVRRNSHWASSDLKIKGAVRENPNEIEWWADRYAKDKTIVLYCA
jgi:hypothetical protein